MSLVSDKLCRIELGDNEWVDIPSEFAYVEMLELIQQKEEESQGQKFGRILNMIVKAWSFSDPLTKENIARISTVDGEKIVSKMTELLQVDKKKPQK